MTEGVTAVAAMMAKLTGEVDRMWSDTKDVAHGQQAMGEALTTLSQRLLDELKHTQEPSQARHEHLISVLTALPSQVTAMSATNQEGVMMEKLGEVRTQLEAYARGQDATTETVGLMGSTVEKLRGEVERMWSDMKERGIDQRAQAAQQMAQVPMMVKGVLSDMMKDVESQWTHARSVSKTTQQQVAKVEGDVAGTTTALAVQRKMIEDVAGKLDAMAQQMTRSSSSQRVKGQQGENGLYELLCDRLTTREDYDIQVVSGQAHGCDINIRRLGHADVRLESKAHGEGTGEKVRAKEVARFQSDLMGLNVNGIFVSLHSGIVGKGEMEIDQLSNGKFAVYLSNNKYDVGVIHDMLMLLYRLDKITAAAAGEGDAAIDDTIKVPQETMRRVQMYLKDFAGKVAVTKTHLKDSMSLLSELTFDVLERLLLGQLTVANIRDNVPDDGALALKCTQEDGGGVKGATSYTCTHCGKQCKSKCGLVMHERSHARMIKSE